MKGNRAFSLLELLIVVAIILIIATIAIPSLLRSRQAANETAAVANMRTLNTAEVSYSSFSGGRFGLITELTGAGFVDSRYSGRLSGYDIAIDVAAGGLNYTAYAIAASSNTGRYDYYTIPDYVVRYSTVATRAPVGLGGAPVR